MSNRHICLIVLHVLEDGVFDRIICPTGRHILLVGTIIRGHALSGACVKGGHVFQVYMYYERTCITENHVFN